MASNWTFPNSIVVAGNTGKGYTYSGTITGSAAANNVTLNTKAGTATFTGQTCANAGTLTLTINSTAIGSAGLVNFTCSAAPSVTSALYIASVTWTNATSVAVQIANAGAQSTGSVNWTISFVSFN